ncbi:MAG: hypothetical protein K0R84_1606 [Clostridia bacterium]|nr:hypothetical protein [Clostridia bacterium]
MEIITVFEKIGQAFKILNLRLHGIIKKIYKGFKVKFRKVIWLLPFISLSIILGVWGWHASLDKYEPALLTIEVTIAIFAVNFSFLEYQFSPYRAVLRSISRIQIAASVTVLLIALAPLISLVFDKSWTPTIALVTIPILAYATVALTMVSRHEANPMTLINKMCSKQTINQFLCSYSKDAEILLDELNKMELTKPADMPTHEWNVRITPNPRLEDPFNILASLGLASIQSSDIYTFANTVTRMLEAIEWAGEKKRADGKVPGYKVDSVIALHSHQSLIRISVASFELDKSGTFATKYLEICALFVSNQSVRMRQTSNVVVGVMNTMIDVAKKLMQNGKTDSALIPVIVSRQSAQKGIDSLPTDVFLFEEHLSYLPNAIKSLGQEAIKLGNTDFLYRCLDSLSWLGCSTVKNNSHYIGLECLQGLIQLGRESRAANLECFWSHCSLLPADHAYERIYWMLTWVLSLAQDKRENWLDSISEALSRLSGTSKSVSIKISDNGKETLLVTDSGEPHSVTYNDNGRVRTMDYSDISFMKELKLY